MFGYGVSDRNQRNTPQLYIDPFSFFQKGETAWS